MTDLGLLKKIVAYSKRRGGYVAGAFAGAALSVAGALAIPVLIGKAVDFILSAGKVDFTAVARILIWLAVAVAANSVFGWLTGLCTSKVAYLAARDIRKDAFARLHTLPVSYIDSRSRGDLASRLTTDTELVAEGLLQGATQAFTGIATIIGTLVLMFTINAIIAAVAVVLTPMSLFAAAFIAKRSHKSFIAQSEARGGLSGLAEEIISAEREVKSFSYEGEAERRFSDLNRELYVTGVKSQFYSSLTNPATRFVNSVVYACVGVIGALLVVSGNGMTVGGLTSFLQYANQYTKPFNEISGVFTEIQTALAAAKRVFSLLEEPPEPSDAELPALTEADGTFTFDNADFSYDPQKEFIKGLCLDVKKGAHVAVVGPTGCGKTTLINLLMRFYDATGGEVRVGGSPVDSITRKSLRKSCGMVLQDSWLFDGTVKENIGYGSDADDEEIINAAKEAFADDFIKGLKDGYDTRLRGGENLSEGQKQLICIARAMLAKPAILILDEATSSVDTRTEIKIQAAFDRLTKGRTCFVVAHRLSTVRNADEIVVMRDGKIIERGPHEILMRNGGFYRSLYESAYKN